ncbi:hypothetical protein GGI12_005805 [Dipsacomyces acuminosporus]|nr:hypothetical protein GGI12_005805 [Dipsacomyces acuminosporus]
MDFAFGIRDQLLSTEKFDKAAIYDPAGQAVGDDNEQFLIPPMAEMLFAGFRESGIVMGRPIFCEGKNLQVANANQKYILATGDGVSLAAINTGTPFFIVAVTQRAELPEVNAVVEDIVNQFGI